jgi:hypothetical protein
MPAAKYMMPFWCGGSRCRAAVRCECVARGREQEHQMLRAFGKRVRQCSADRQPRAWAAATSASSMRCAR